MTRRHILTRLSIHLLYNPKLFIMILKSLRLFTLCLLGFLLSPVMGWAQSTTVSGTVASADGAGLPGATVSVKGTTSGVFADSEGNYSIQVPNESAVLVFSYIGYLKQEVPVNGQGTINVTLEEGVNQLQDVVIVGYGSQERGDLTGAISSVKGTDIQNLPVTGASQALQGRSAGVSVVRNGGAPGEGGSIRIRGTGTVNNSEPLVVIDGVPSGSLDDINPNDIESIEILKDASAAAIYGLRAANGVVIVTTKRGRFNEDISFTLNGYAGVSNAVNLIDVLEADDLATLKLERYANDGIDPNPIWNDPQYRVQRTNWQEELLGSGLTQNYDFSMRGGGEKSAFAISAGWFEEQGMIKNSYSDRSYIRINSDHQVNKWLKIGENLQLTRQTGNFLNTTSAQTGVIWSAIRFHPGLPVIDQNGDYGSSQVSGEFGDINNPIFTVDTEDDQFTRHRVLGNVFFEAEVFTGLKLKANFALDGTIYDRDVFNIIVDKQIRANSRNNLTREYSEGYSLLGEYFISYDNLLAEKHAINFVGGYTAQQFNTETLSAQRRDFPNEDPDQRFLNTGNTISGASGGKSEDALASWFARLNYNFDGKYLLTATFRADGSSRFAEGNKWGYFPAFSAGWRISEESFFNSGLISTLKVTGGWGQLGNQSVASLQYLAIISSGRRYSFGGAEVVGANQTRIPNADISWETSEMTNIGLEFGLFNDALLGSVNYFIKDTKDMLLAPPTVGTIGRASVPDQNVGEIRNNGLELELSYSNTVGDFGYSISANAAFIQNEVTQLFDGNFLASQFYGRPNQEISRTFEGEPIGTFYGWKTDGLYQTQADIDGDANIANDPRRANGQIQPGDVRFLDLNGDGQITADDRTILGDPFPGAEYGINTNFEYKGFDLNLFFLGQAGLELYNADRMQGLDPTYPFNMYAETLNRWNGPGTSNTIPRMTTNRNNLNHRTSDLFIEKGDFFRLKNMTLGYTLPTAATQVIGIDQVRLYVSGQNVFTITDYSGLDPEMGYIDGNLQRGVDYARYPQARTWLFGASISF